MRKTAKKAAPKKAVEAQNVGGMATEDEVTEIETARGGKKRSKGGKASAKKSRTSLAQPEAIPSSPLSDIAELPDEPKSVPKGKGPKKSAGTRGGGKQKPTSENLS